MRKLLVLFDTGLCGERLADVADRKVQMGKNNLGKPLPERRHSEKLKRDLRALALASTTALLAASGAHAGQIDITNVGVQSYETTDLSGTINGAAFNESAITTLILLTTTGGTVLPVFCVDLLHNINIGGYDPPLTYITGAVSTDSTGPQPGTGNTLPNPPVPGEIQALANLGAEDYLNGVTDPDVYTAIAAAIWYDEYNTDGDSVSITGDSVVGTATLGFPATGLIAVDLAYAAAYATNYSTGLYPGTTGEGFVGYGQGFVFVNVPEPSTWAMMLLGFAGLGFAGYRRTRAKVAIDV
jgi:PEP-CTERM motif